jgi:hypothetical protein
LERAILNQVVPILNWGTIMSANQNDILSPEWPGDFNQTIGIFLEEYRRQASRKRHQRTWASVMFGLTAASAVFVAAWPVAKSALG